MTSQRSILLGLLFLGTLGILGYYTLFLTDFTLFRSRPRLVVHFPEASGLRRGDSVLVAGVRQGRVETVTFDPDADDARRVTVTLSLDDPVLLRDGFEIVIEDATVLGGHNLRIEPGPADAPPIAEGTQLQGRIEANALAALRDLVDRNESNVTGLLEDARELVRVAREGRGPLGRAFNDEALADEIGELVRSSSKTAQNLEAVTSDLRQGRGFVGRLLTDDSLYDDLSNAVERLSTTLDEAVALARAARTGEGVIGALVSDKEMAENVRSSIADVREIISRVERAEGTLGLLISDDAIASNVEVLTDSLASGRGTLGRLFTQPDLYEYLDQIAENLAVVSTALREGQGTLGRIVMDDELYLQIKLAMGIVTRTLEEYREAAPVTTFTSVLFGAF